MFNGCSWQQKCLDVVIFSLSILLGFSFGLIVGALAAAFVLTNLVAIIIFTIIIAILLTIVIIIDCCSGKKRCCCDNHLKQ